MRFNQRSYFGKGILFAKLGKKRSQLPKCENEVKTQWQLEGWDEAHNPKRAGSDEVLIKDKEIYEDIKDISL